MTKENQSYSSWSENLNAFKNAKFPWGDNEFIMSSYRRNMEFMNTSQQIAVETIKAVTELQTDYIKSMFGQLSERTKQGLSASSPEEKAARQTDSAIEIIDHAVEHAREINSIMAKSSDKVIENIQKTAKKNLEDAASLAKNAAKRK